MFDLGSINYDDKNPNIREDFINNRNIDSRK